MMLEFKTTLNTSERKIVLMYHRIENMTYEEMILHYLFKNRAIFFIYNEAIGLGVKTLTFISLTSELIKFLDQVISDF